MPSAETRSGGEGRLERPTVVVADGNTGRGNRIVDECSAAGFACRLAAHGAAALETALATRPAVMIAPLDLPLVDAVKLAEILRANPRTRDTRFVFLGAEGDLGSSAGIGDRLLESDARPHDIVMAAAEVIERQHRIESLDALSRPGATAEGELGDLPLADLLQSLLLQRRSGRLEVRREGEHAGPGLARLTLRDGEVIQAEVGEVYGEKALFRVMAWPAGRFVFEAGEPDEPALILVPTRRLLVEALRQLGEWDRLSTRLPPLDSPVRLDVKSSELPDIVHPLTREVLALLGQHSTVRDVLDHSVFPDYQVLRTLHTLDERGLIELGRAPLPEPPVSEPFERLLSDVQARRLADWIRDRGAGADADRAVAKLLIAASSPACLPEFLRLLGAVPEVDLEVDLERGGAAADGLATLGRVAVSDEIVIELVNVPTGEVWSPLWPMAGHGALGTLCLLEPPVGEAADRLGSIASSLSRLPRARTFQVVLLGKDDRLGPDELRENLTLGDEASLFLLPTQSDKDPAALLRGLFARVMP